MADTRAIVTTPDDAPPLVMTYLGHSTVCLELDGRRVLTDPILRDRVGPLVRATNSIGPDAWADIDLVLLSHSHWDHLDVGSLRLLGASVPLVVPRGMGRRLLAQGFREVHEVVPGDTLEHGGLSIETTPAEHRGFGPPIGPTSLAVGYLVRGSRSLYFAGDTALFDAMRELDIGLDLALMPVWGWGPRARPTEHLDPLGAAQAVGIIRPRLAVPIHWGTLHPVGMRWLRPDTRIEPPREFARRVAELAPRTEVAIVPIGERLVIDGRSRAVDGADERGDPVEDVLEHGREAVAQPRVDDQFRGGESLGDRRA